MGNYSSKDAFCDVAGSMSLLDQLSSAPAPNRFLAELTAAGHLIPTGVDGVYGRGGVFEQVLEGLDRLITDDNPYRDAQVMRFPPAMARKTFEESQYLKGFPRFAGTVHSFCGDERGHREMLRCIGVGEDWTGQQVPSDLVLAPASCYPVYGIMKRRGPVPDEGWVVDVSSYCFRREPSLEPTRMQMFRQREFVRIGSPGQAQTFRSEWMSRASRFVGRLGLPHALDVANDPFFGRMGTLMANNQREQSLKFEVLIPVNDGLPPTACGSANSHLDHFASIWGLTNAQGEMCHTACCAYGMERLTLAMFRHHGLEVRDWTDELRALLRLD